MDGSTSSHKNVPADGVQLIHRNRSLDIKWCDLSKHPRNAHGAWSPTQNIRSVNSRRGHGCRSKMLPTELFDYWNAIILLRSLKIKSFHCTDTNDRPKVWGEDSISGWCTGSKPAGKRNIILVRAWKYVKIKRHMFDNIVGFVILVIKRSSTTLPQFVALHIVWSWLSAKEWTRDSNEAQRSRAKGRVPKPTVINTAPWMDGFDMNEERNTNSSIILDSL